MSKSNRDLVDQIYPMVHMNGTGKKMLMDGYVAAIIAVGEARKAIGMIEFNARDYYPLGDDQWIKAKEQRFAMLARLTSVEDYLLAHAEHIEEVTRR